MLHCLLRIAEEDLYQYILFAIGAIIAWAFLLRWAIKVNTITKNQDAIIQLLILQCKKQGATEEEIKLLTDAYGIVENKPSASVVA